MKKIKSLTAILAITALIITGCGITAPTKKPARESIEAENTESEEMIQTDTNSETTEDGQDENQIDLIYTFEDPSEPIVFDYPNLKCIEEGTSRVFKNSKYVIVYCRDNGNCELEDIPDALSEKFYYATDIHLTAPFESFQIEETALMSVSGQEVLQINGYVVVKRSGGTLVNLPMQGYTFIKDDLICELIAVLNEENNETDQLEIHQKPIVLKHL